MAPMDAVKALWRDREFLDVGGGANAARWRRLSLSPADEREGDLISSSAASPARRGRQRIREALGELRSKSRSCRLPTNAAGRRSGEVGIRR